MVARDNRTVLLRGEVSLALQQLVARNQDALYKMLKGDPMFGPGWEGRTALFRQAMKYVDQKAAKRHGEKGKKRTVKAMCHQREIDRLNEAWIGSKGNFELFRDALKEYVKVGLEAASGSSKISMKANT